MAARSARMFVFDSSLWILLALCALLVALAWARGGAPLVQQGFEGGGRMLVRYGLVIAVSFLAAGFAEVLLPRTWLQSSLGETSGLRGILLASGLGMVTPAGPFVAMPIAAVMLRSGAGVAPVVAFLTAWALLALHRLVAWEIPILGWRVAALRYGVSLAIPVLAGLAARSLRGLAG
jgi:uncharacterized membrane protein YraQ (UPF0718 family)